MLYRLVGSPTIETHNENMMRLFVRDSNGAPAPNVHVKVWGGPPPNGTPPYFVDDLPFRTTNPSGMIEYFAVIGPMPDPRDYWMQILSGDGTPQSDPIQFHFARGSTIWIVATVRAGEGGTPPPIGGPVTGNVEWDPRLSDMHISIAPVSTLGSGQAYWKIIAAQYQDETQSGGNHNLFFTVLDENGLPAPGVPVLLDWDGREPNDVPETVYTDGNGTANYGLYHGPVGWNPDAGPGPYSGWAGDPDLRGNNPGKIPGEKFVGVGLPMNRHVNYIVTWRKVRSGAPVATSSVRGNIKNASPNAVLTLASSGQTFTANVDALGNFAFVGLPAGAYALALAGSGVINSNIDLDGTNHIIFNYTVPAQPPGKPITHYLLFGPPTSSSAHTNLILALDYITRFAPTVGFSVGEAQCAQNVTVVGDSATASDEQVLKNAGCTVRHIAGPDSHAVEKLLAQLVASGNAYPSG